MHITTLIITLETYFTSAATVLLHLFMLYYAFIHATLAASIDYSFLSFILYRTYGGGETNVDTPGCANFLYNLTIMSRFVHFRLSVNVMTVLKK